MSYVATTKKCLPRIFVRHSLPPSHHRHKKPLRACSDTLSRHTDINHVLTRCHVTDINHVLARCHVTEINYVDRGAAARAPLQYTEGPLGRRFTNDEEWSRREPFNFERPLATLSKDEYIALRKRTLSSVKVATDGIEMCGHFSERHWSRVRLGQ
jgi:hypothetical protein